MLRAALLLTLASGLAAGSAWARDDDVKDLVVQLEKNKRDPFEQREREAAIRKLADLATPEAAEALVDVLDDPFEHLHDRVVSAWIQMLRSNRSGDLHTMFAQRLLGHRNASVRCGAATALGLSSGAEMAGDFRQALRSEKDADVLVCLCQGAMSLREKPDLAGAFVPLLGHKSGTVVEAAASACVRYETADDVDEALRKVLTRHKDPVARAGALQALAARGTLAATDFTEVFSDGASEPRVALARALPSPSPHLAVPGPGTDVLVALLGDASWRVRVAAVQASLRLWNAAVVMPLIRRLEVETGRVREDVHRALVTITGADVAPDAQLWTVWWAARGETFDPGERPEADAGGRIRFREPRDAAGKPGTKTVAFYDLPITSERLVFVFDLSGSMGKADGDANGRSKLDVLRERFAALLAELPESTLVDVWVWRYPSSYPPKPKLERAFDRLQPLTAANRVKAERWMAKQEAKGWGAFFEPIEAALGEDIDTLVLLSDGVPSRGRYERRDRLLAEVAKANRYAGLRVDTILAGTKGTDRAFMDDLAASTGGRFRAVGKQDER